MGISSLEEQGLLCHWMVLGQVELWVLEVGIQFGKNEGFGNVSWVYPTCFRGKGLWGLSQGLSGWDEHKKLLDP